MAEQEIYETRDEVFTNTTKIDQVVYDCYGNSFLVHPGESVVIKKQVRVGRTKTSAKESEDVVDKGESEGESPKVGGEPKVESARGTFRHFNRRRA